MGNRANAMLACGEATLGNYTAEALRSLRRGIESNLCELCGHEKKSKNDKIRKIGINKFKYLQRRFLRETDFFSRPASLW